MSIFTDLWAKPDLSKSDLKLKLFSITTDLWAKQDFSKNDLKLISISTDFRQS